MHSTSGRLLRLVAISAIGLTASACGSGGPTSRPSDATVSRTAVPSVGPDSTPGESPSVSGPAGAEPPGGTTSGDVPDNAVFLTYRGAGSAYSIEYVEGWQVTPQADGVVIRDKDSSENVTIVRPAPDVLSYVANTDLPALRAQPGFELIGQDTVDVGSVKYVHLAYRVTSPPDPVTGKRVPQVADRYYAPGPQALAIITLATPDGVDNIDAFRQMIESFKWS